MLVVDIGVAQHCWSPGKGVALAGQPDFGAAAPPLSAVVGDQLRLIEPDENDDLVRLTESFHLNLTAFGLLAFVVGLFIVHSAIGLAFEQRLPMMRTLRACGVSASALTAVLLVELISLALIGGAVGVICGYLIATALLPDVVASLRGLYGVRVAGPLTLEYGLVARRARHGRSGSFGGSWRQPSQSPSATPARSGATLCVARGAAEMAEPPGSDRRRLLQRGPRCLRFRSEPGHRIRHDGRLAARRRASAAAGAQLGPAARRAMGRPSALEVVLGRQSAAVAQLVPRADGALLALAANVGVGTMVEGFRKTFMEWLNQRLVAEIYLEANTDEQAQAIKQWLDQRPEVEAILPNWSARPASAAGP